jgi:hypothetical protein
MYRRSVASSYYTKSELPCRMAYAGLSAAAFLKPALVNTSTMISRPLTIPLPASLTFGIVTVSLSGLGSLDQCRYRSYIQLRKLCFDGHYSSNDVDMRLAI